MSRLPERIDRARYGYDRRRVVMRVHLDVPARVAATGVRALAHNLIAGLGPALRTDDVEIVKVTYPKQELPADVR